MKSNLNILVGSDFLRGSIRSIPTIDMYSIMEEVQFEFETIYNRNPYQIKVGTLIGERLVNAFGGHSLACGFSIHKDDVDKWEELLRARMNQLESSQFEYTYNIIQDIKFSEINYKLLLELDTISPYGEGFDFPTFCLKNVNVSAPRPFGNRMQKDRTPHLEFKVLQKASDKKLKQKQRYLKALGFGLYEKFQNLTFENHNGKFDIIFTLDYPYSNLKRGLFLNC